MADKPSFPDYFHFQHPLVRDLCWTLSPSFDLLGDLPPYQRFRLPQSTAVLSQWLANLQRHPQPLQRFVEQESRRRLGHHFERLILFYLTHAPDQPLQLLDHNLPIYSRNSAGHQITIGELDFLLSSPTDRVHLETAVKFFLGIEFAGKVHWLGPGLEDRLDHKLRHLQEHQLPLSQRLETPSAMPFQRHFWLKGHLFHPWQQTLALGSSMLAQPLTHRWLSCTQALDVTEDGQWLALPKASWLGCGVEHPQDHLVTRARIEQHFADSDRVLMLWHRESAERRLIVADHWPQAARAALAARQT